MHQELDIRCRCRLHAEWTRFVPLGQLLEAVPVHFVPAPKQHAQTLALVVYLLLAAGAEGDRRVVMIVLSLDTHASLAYVTVEEVTFATCFAHSTLLAMKNLLTRIVVEQVADLAEVFTEGDLALSAVLCWWLDSRTPITLDLFD